MFGASNSSLTGTIRYGVFFNATAVATALRLTARFFRLATISTRRCLPLFIGDLSMNEPASFNFAICAVDRHGFGIAAAPVRILSLAWTDFKDRLA